MSETDQNNKRPLSPTPADRAEEPVEKKAHLESAPNAPSTSADALSASTTAAVESKVDEEDAFNNDTITAATSNAPPALTHTPNAGQSSHDAKPAKKDLPHNQHKARGQVKQDKRAAQRGKYKHDHFAPGQSRAERDAAEKQRKAAAGDGEGGTGAGGEGDGEGEGEGEGGRGEGSKRLSKKKCALIIGFCGTGYQGMQIQADQTDVKTIEGDVFDALCKAGAVSKENAESHKKVDIQRSARTDAGVHAAGNVISLKMIYDPPLPEGFSSLKDYVNSFLPDQIRMWGFVRTLKSFQARMACDSRVYEYLLPSYCLLPPASRDAICKRLDKSSPGWRDGLGPGAAFVDEMPEMTEAGEGEQLSPKERGEFERRRGWRVDKETLDRFRGLVKEYLGTHNFHNYTVGKPFNDRTVKRYMMSIEVREPVVHGDIEWISVRIHGQSFMLHQIRKMMSLAMLACRTNTPPSLIAETYGPKKIHIPKAPPLGLLLQRPVFKTYNERIKHVGGGGGKKQGSGAAPAEDGDGNEREPVDLSIYEDEMEAFKLKWIYERLRQDELENNVFHKWIRQVDCSSSAAYAFLKQVTFSSFSVTARLRNLARQLRANQYSAKGVIPPEAAHTYRHPGSGSKKDQSGNKANDGPTKAGASDGDAKNEDGNGDGDDEDKVVESDDEDLDMAALKRGELEG